jgi:hypothetical protein
MAKATVAGLKMLRRPEDVARMRGKTITEILPLSKARLAELREPAVAPETVEDTTEIEATAS